MAQGKASPSSRLVALNVGGAKFTTSLHTLTREPDSMLASMFSGCLPNARDEKGRIFIDRDPKRFALILNYLRDGTCVLPADSLGIEEVLQEAEFYQLEGLKAYVGHNVRWQPHTAQLLKHCIERQIQGNTQLREVVDLLLHCAYGSKVYEGQGKTPPRRAQLCVRLRETAFNAICSQLQERDETLYVAFQQHICFKGPMHKDEYEAKHETHLIHDGSPSYDPGVYGGTYPHRFHIKTVQVYQHHCQQQLPDDARRLRNAATYIVSHQDAVQWGLEMCGFRDVQVRCIQQQHSNHSKGELFNNVRPVLFELECSLSMSL